MPPLALFLVLLSAISHASWNLAVKGSRDKYAFSWCMMAAGFLLTLPAVLFLPVRFTAASMALLGASSIAEALYLIALAASYERLPYTIAYPVARGSAPAFIVLFAWLLLGERIPPVGLAGIFLVSAGIFWLHGSDYRNARGRFLLLPLASGLCVAGFSVADKAALHYFSPLALACLMFGGTAVLLAPYVTVVRRASLVTEFRRHWRRVLIVAALSVGGYALVLAAMRLAPVSYVGAARESSVLFAVVLGWSALDEGSGLRRALGATAIFAGIVLLVAAR